MKRKFTSILLIASTSLILSLFVACGPAVLPATQTPTALPTFTASPVVMLTDTPVCEGLCPSDSMTATAAMKATLDAIPSNTPPAGVTITPSVGDLGWGAVYGKIIDGTTGLPIEGATVTCEHFSYTSNYLCHGVTTTNSDGIYSFVPVFFHDTDRITLLVEAPGYAPLHFEQNSFTRPEFHADLGLFPALMCTPPVCEGGTLACGDPNGCPGGCGTICRQSSLTPLPVCTAPACENGTLVCGDPNGCPGGCGTICRANTLTPFPLCTPPACVDGVLTCGDPNGCPGGCGTICRQITPTP